jgi:carboxylate-amine ligase
MLLDPQTLDLVQRSERILRSERGGDFADLVAPELFESYLEFHTPVCRSLDELQRGMARLRAHAVASAEAAGLLLGCAGTHPFSRFEDQHVTRRPRYRAIVDALQYAARRYLVFGLHVHVAVPDADEAIALMAAIEPHLCELVALSASSPLWRGAPTGFASCRPLIFAAMPRSGPPPRFADYGEFATVVQRLVACGAIEDYTHLWWDVRPHPRFGTLEVRVMDAVTRVDDAVALAAYVQALVRYHAARLEAGETGRTSHPALTHESKWRAARFGLAATVDDARGDGPAPVTRLIERTLEEIAPHARELGGDAALEGIRRILRDGNGADRQLRCYAATGDSVAVARDIAAATRAGLPARW